MVNTKIDNDIIAFTHIKKAAGTTFTHILRQNFFLRHCDVMPLCKESNGIFQTPDLNILLKINPFLKSIAGHSLLPHGDLLKSAKRIKFITLLRDPVERYISQYLYNVSMNNYGHSFDDFLNDPDSFNKQTRTISGSDNLFQAKTILKEHYFLVGTVEEFDNFLFILQRKLLPQGFNTYYRKINVARKQSPIRINIQNKFNKYYDKIKDRNSLDIELYRFVKNHLFEEEKIKADVINFQNNLNGTRDISLILKQNIDYLFRKIYYKPFLHIIRKINNVSVREAV